MRGNIAAPFHRQLRFNRYRKTRRTCLIIHRPRCKMIAQNRHRPTKAMNAEKNDKIVTIGSELFGRWRVSSPRFQQVLCTSDSHKTIWGEGFAPPRLHVNRNPTAAPPYFSYQEFSVDPAADCTVHMCRSLLFRRFRVFCRHAARHARIYRCYRARRDKRPHEKAEQHQSNQLAIHKTTHSYYISDSLSGLPKNVFKSSLSSITLPCR